MTDPRVSMINVPRGDIDSAVIVLSYNGLEILKRCLPSSFDQGTVVLVDNGSTDNTVDYVIQAWPNVAVISIECNVPLGQALNIGARSIEARNIALLNNDVIVLDDAVKRICALLDAEPSIGLASPLLINEDESVQEFGNDMHISGLALRPSSVTRPLFDTFFQSGCVTAVRRDQFLKLGGYGDVFEWYYEDVDLAWRFRNAGLRVVVDEGARCVHLRGSTLGSSAVLDRGRKNDERHAARMYYSNRNVLLLFARNAPWYQCAVQVPFILARQMTELLAALGLRDDRLAIAYIRAWRDACVRLPRAMNNVNGSMKASRRSTLRFVRVQIVQIVDRLRMLGVSMLRR